MKNGTNRVIWAIGVTDDLDYHGFGEENRATISINLIADPLPPHDVTS